MFTNWQLYFRQSEPGSLTTLSDDSLVINSVRLCLQVESTTSTTVWRVFRLTHGLRPNPKE